jgi:manganese-dependent inorganic pyrophosphatase
MKLRKEREKLDLIYFCIVDITHNNSTMIAPGDKELELAEKAFQAKANNNSLFLPGMVSRKSQLLPMITQALQ